MIDPTRRGIGIGEIIALFSASALGVLLRAPDALLNPQFIVEDGSVFSGQSGRLPPPFFGPGMWPRQRAARACHSRWVRFTISVDAGWAGRPLLSYVAGRGS